MLKIWKGGLATVILAGALGWASVASAAPISGTFSLLADGSSNVLAGTVIGSGSFTTKDISTEVQSPYTTLAGDIIPNAVLLDAFTLTNTDIGVTFSLGDFGNANEPVAVLAGPGSSNVQFIFGTAINPNNGTAASLVLSFDSADQTQGTFLSGTTIANAISGDQQIPEPAPIALLGAGVLAIGLVRFRRKKKES